MLGYLLELVVSLPHSLLSKTYQLCQLKHLRTNGKKQEAFVWQQTPCLHGTPVKSEMMTIVDMTLLGFPFPFPGFQTYKVQVHNIIQTINVAVSTQTDLPWNSAARHIFCETIDPPMLLQWKTIQMSYTDFHCIVIVCLEYVVDMYLDNNTDNKLFFQVTN